MLTLATANALIAAAFAAGAGMKPLSIVVLDAGGHVVAFQRADGASNLRFEIARAKAYGALAVGMGSRALFRRAQEQPFFTDALNGLADGRVMPVPGGVLIRNAAGQIIGAVGVTGDTSDNDEIAAVAGIKAVGLTPDAG